MSRYMLAVLLLACVAVPVRANEPITIGERVTIASRVMGEQRTLLISPPRSYGRGLNRYPVLYMTDGDLHLTHTRGTVDFLVSNGLMPDVIIVGVTNTNRTRDLTPTHAFNVRADGTRVEVVGSGGAGKFLDFFAQELIPYVEQHYRTLPYRIFSGHSYGGLFALHALAARPELFQALIAASPSLNFDDNYPLHTLETFFKGRKELSRTLFVTMANEEAGNPAPTLLERLQQLLGSVQVAGFEWGCKLMADETHGSVVLRSHYWGLRKIFEAWPLPIGPLGRFQGSVEDVKNHYAALAQRLGFTIVPPEDPLNTAGYIALQENEIDKAIALFRYNVEIHSLSANVHDSLGEALERAGRLAEARDSYVRAVARAVANADGNLALFTANRDRVAAALAQGKTDK